MFFQAAGVEVQPWIPSLVAFAISFFTSMGWVSGSFLLLPFQMSFLGYTIPSVSATNQLFNVVAIPSGVYRYWREGRMVWLLTWIVVAGILLGAVVRVRHLPDPKHFKIFAAAVLLFIGVRRIRDLLGKRSGANTRAQSEKRFQEMVKCRGQERISRRLIIFGKRQPNFPSSIPDGTVTPSTARSSTYRRRVFLLSLIVGAVG